MFGVTLDGHDEYGFGFMRMNVNGKPEIRWQVSADLAPLLSGIVGPQHIPVLLHEENIRARGVHGDAVYAMADFSVRIGQPVLRLQSPIDWLPVLAAVVGAERAGRR